MGARFPGNSSLQIGDLHVPSECVEKCTNTRTTIIRDHENHQWLWLGCCGYFPIRFLISLFSVLERNSVLRSNKLHVHKLFLFVSVPTELKYYKEELNKRTVKLHNIKVN